MKFNVICHTTGMQEFEVPFSVKTEGEITTLTVKREELVGKRCNYLAIWSDKTTVKAGKGNMVYPTNFAYGCVLTHFKERADCSWRHHPSTMPVAAICEIEDAVFLHALGCGIDCRFYVECKSNLYSLVPEFVFDGDDPDEDIVIIYKNMPYATYSDMAIEYRNYQLTEGGCEPISEKVKKRPEVDKALNCLELRVRMGWKPQPTPVRRQTVENEPEMYVACTIADLNKVIDKMKDVGVKGAEICLVGWAVGGHDGRFPQHYPTDERFGTDDELRAFIDKAKSYGYMVTCHSNSMGAYEIANNFDWEKLVQRAGMNGDMIPWIRDGYKASGLQGGEPYMVCPKFADEYYAKKDFPVIRSYGFEGLHYVDELSACEPMKCYAKDHALSRRDIVEHYRNIAKRSIELFGGCQSEAWFDFNNSHMDYSLYTSVHSELVEGRDPEIFDEIVPFFVLVYHGIVMSNAASATINYPIKKEFERLRAIEFGSRPLLYINSMFCGRDWMGKVDLYNKTDEDIETAALAMKKAQDDYEPLKHLQYHFMNKHERISEGVYRITYSNGEVIEVDYNKGDYKLYKA